MPSISVNNNIDRNKKYRLIILRSDLFCLKLKKSIIMMQNAKHGPNRMNSSLTDSPCITDLFRSEILQQMQDNFARATKVASIITLPDGTPVTNPSNFTRLCRNNKDCFNFEMEETPHEELGPRITRCKTLGLWEAGARIVVGGVHIANWLIGQVRDETQTEEEIRIKARKAGMDEEQAVKDFQDVPFMPKEQFREVACLLNDLASRMSEYAYKNLILKRNIDEIKEIEKALRLSQDRFKSLVETTTDFIWEMDTQANFLYVSPQVKNLLGYEPEELLGTSGFDLMPPEEAEKINIQFEEYVEQGLPFRNLLNINLHKDGHAVYLESNGEPFFDESGRLLGYRGSDRDITERIQMEEQMLQTQKMESLGQLAGGVAHDFNNMLMGIMGNTELLLQELGDRQDLHPYLEMTMESAERAADLARNLLVFGKRNALTMQEVDLHEILLSIVEIFQKVANKKIRIEIQLKAENAMIEGKDAQLQSVFMNLFINASHAMPEGGNLYITTENVNLDKQFCSQSSFQLEPGKYIRIRIKDTGEGIQKEHRHRVFDPFFTTKSLGKGTGLGLSAVYSTTVQHRGMVTLNSKVGNGTEFVLSYPLK